jgi:hypothetical protein
MKDKINDIFNLINESEKIIELSFLNEIEKNKNFKEAIDINDDSKVVKKLDLNFTLKRISSGEYSTDITDNDNQSLNLLKLHNVGSAKTDISPKGTFIKLKKDVIKNLKDTFKDIKII